MSGAENRKEFEQQNQIDVVELASHAGSSLERIVFIGRTFDEYMRMFDLDVRTLNGLSILDCPAGACSFTATASAMGCTVTAVDIAYYHNTENLYEKGQDDIDTAMEHVESERERYHWTEFQSVADLREERTLALETCVNDMRNHPERYEPVTLPLLPFEDEQFDMTLSAHFLFTYADRLDAEFHLHTLKELLRVTKGEIRIFPLVDQSGRRSEHVDILTRYALDEGWEVEIKAASYHFQMNADHMLILRNKK